MPSQSMASCAVVKRTAPSAADGQQGRLFIGFAAAELLGLLAFVVAMILLFVV